MGRLCFFRISMLKYLKCCVAVDMRNRNALICVMSSKLQKLNPCFIFTTVYEKIFANYLHNFASVNTCFGAGGLQ